MTPATTHHYRPRTGGSADLCAEHAADDRGEDDEATIGALEVSAPAPGTPCERCEEQRADAATGAALASDRAQYLAARSELVADPREALSVLALALARAGVPRIVVVGLVAEVGELLPPVTR